MIAPTRNVGVDDVHSEMDGPRPVAEMLLNRAQICHEMALLHRERGKDQVATLLEGKAWGFKEAAGHLLLRGHDRSH